MSSAGDAGDLLGQLGRVGLDGRGELGEAFAAFVDERLVVQALGDDHVHHRVDQRHVRAGLLPQVHVGEFGQLDASRVGDDELRACPTARLTAEPMIGWRINETTE